MSIRILPPDIVCRVQAGEVVSRPASVVKELVENALDAGSRTISITLTGESSAAPDMTVSDDGGGMTLDDITLCLLPHATSKLVDSEALGRVPTFGFRGEALAAIARMAHVTIQSRRADAEHGWLVEAIDGLVGEPRPCSCPAGTTIVSVRGLFAQFPARLKFLRRAAQEIAAVTKVVEDAALARPDVAFALQRPGRSDTLRFVPSDWLTRLRAVSGDGMATNSLVVDWCEADWTLRGLIGLPGWRGAPGQHLLVRGRPVADTILSGAIKAAYADVSGAQTPPAMLLLDLPAGEVDSNVHPEKAQVRFRDPPRVAALVRQALRAALGGNTQAARDLQGVARRAAKPLDTFEAANDRRSLPLGRGLGIVGKGYAVCDSARSGLVILDLHAAAERAAYERLLSQLNDGLSRRELTHPALLAATDAMMTVAGDAQDSLHKLGFTLQAMGSQTLAIQAVPAFLPDHLAGHTVQELLCDLLDNPSEDPGQGFMSGVCARLACHAAFRFGDEIDMDTLDSLLRQIEQTPRYGTCPHGRPTTRAISPNELAALFGR